MNRIPLLIFGASGHARVILDMAERCDQFNILGLLDSFKPVGEKLMGYPVLGNESMLPYLAASHPGLHIHIAIGDNDVRERIAHHLTNLCPEIRFAIIIDPSAILSRAAQIGQGTCIMPGAIINAQAIIGNHCIINSRAVLEHDGKMGDFSSLGPGAVAAGGASIGHAAAVLTGGVIKHGISLGDHAVARTGAVVASHTEPSTVLEGNPATIKGFRNPGDRYL
jgi:sugar O-acyltransferase (sialic acid O-acetyltransferase NeuD family)